MIPRAVPHKLDIACGDRKMPGFTGIDLGADADIVWDLFRYPWPIANGVVEEVYCSHFVEHIPHWRPNWNGREGWWLFWEEVARVCRPDAQVLVIHPYLKSVRAFQDPTHERFIPESTWYYLDRQWREGQRLEHYDTTADFEVVDVTAIHYEREGELPDLTRWDQAADLRVILRRR